MLEQVASWASILGFLTGLIAWIWKRSVRKRRGQVLPSGDESPPQFDMPFAEAIEHGLSLQPRHIAFGSQHWPVAQRRMADDIHMMACSGKVRISGTPRLGVRPEQIPPTMLRELTVYDAAIPKSHVAPRGYTWILGPKDPPIGELSPNEDDGSYWGLRVDSRDIYKYWPKTG